MKIGFDLDNVILPLYENMVKIANFRFKSNIKIEDWKEYKMSDAFPDLITEERLEDIYKAVYTTIMITNMQPYEKAIETLNKHSGSLEYYFITARYGPAQPPTLEWFKLSGLKYNPNNVYFDCEKSELAKSLGIERFAEDSVKNAEALAKKGISVLLYDQPWNRNLKETPLIKRVKNGWDEIDKIFASLYATPSQNQ